MANNTKGYFEEIGGDGYTRVTGETYTCCHCNSVHEVVRGAGLAMCHNCWKPVCDRCHAHGTCTPFESRLERYESRMRARAGRDGMLRAIGVVER